MHVHEVVADLLCPERCAACDAIVFTGAIFCHACRACVNVLGAPECTACGTATAAARACAPCSAAPDPSVRHARAWAAYRVPGSRQPVADALAALKYRGATRLARRMAAVMAARVPDPTVSLVAPVPLHVSRLKARGYNQSALLAHHLARALHLKHVPTVLARTRDTGSQTTQSPAGRRSNVAGAFRVTRPALVRGRRVLLVDDVWTSGATARAAATALRAAGARSVDVVTFARANLS
jgi:ComF family protein